MSNNQYKSELAKIKQYTPEEQKTLYKQYKSSTDPKIKIQIRNILVSSNLKFNYSLAKKYENLVPLEDGIQIINLKLISIIDNNEWDEDKASLITYLEKAAYWSILAESENFQIVKQTKYMKKRYEESGPLQFTSLDQPVSPDNPTSIGDSLVDDISNQYQVTPEEVWFKVKSLTDDREFTILKGVYADKSDKISTEKIGCELGITNQRCSQIKYNAIKKLKRDTYLKNLHQQI